MPVSQGQETEGGKGVCRVQGEGRGRTVVTTSELAAVLRAMSALLPSGSRVAVSAAGAEETVDCGQFDSHHDAYPCRGAR